MIVFKSPAEEIAHYAAMQDRNDYAASPLSATMSYDEWKEFQEFRAWSISKRQHAQGVGAGGANLPAGLPAPQGSKSLKELTAVFRAHLEHRLDNTKPGMRSDEDISEARFRQYGKMKSLRERVAKSMPKALDYSFENFRDTGASYIDTVNPVLTPLYLGQGDTRQAKQYVAQIEDERGRVVMPMHLDEVLAGFEKYLKLPAYQP